MIVADYRGADIIATGNRFVGFALFPDGNVQVVIKHDTKHDQIRVRLGKSIFNHTCKIHLGHLAAEFGGGGVDGAAGFSVSHQEADAKIKPLIERLKGK